MALSSGTFVKNDVTSDETILYPTGTFIFLIYFTNFFVLLMVYSEVPNVGNSLAKYFAA